MKSDNKIIKIIESWATTENIFNSTNEILHWIYERNIKVKVSINKIPYSYHDGFWFYDEDRGEIRNKKNSFFQIKGITCSCENKFIEQPIIIQNEIGYLGIIVKEFEGTYYFLMQAKIEPGNINKVQISPTIQATKSNFMQTHGGKVPSYLDYFSNKDSYDIIIDQIQSEQSSRFFGKRNRNMIIFLKEDIEVLDNFKWMTLGQIKELMKYDNLINMDTRTVLSNIPFALKEYSSKELKYIKSLFQNRYLYNSIFLGKIDSINQIFHYINDVKMLDKREIKLEALNKLNSWKLENGVIFSPYGDFNVVFCDIKIEGREVSFWKQPLLEAKMQSVFCLMYRISNNCMEFLVKARAEIGCFDKIELGPTIQSTSTKKEVLDDVEVYFYENISNKDTVKFEGLFSEEGGRFYQEQNKNIIMEVKGNTLNVVPPGYFWLNFKTINCLIQFNNYLNIQLRNLISILDI